MMKLRSHASTALLFGVVAIGTGCPGSSGFLDQIIDDQLNGVGVVVESNFFLAVRGGESQGESEAAFCNGWFPASPNHTLTINSGINMTIRIIAESDARLWILCGESNFCGSEVSPGVWELTRFWTTGFCEVYVGTPDEGGEVTYELEFESN